MSEKRSLSRVWVLVGLVAVGVVFLFLVQLKEAVVGSGRMVGIGLDMDVEGRLLVFGVAPGGPADRGGLRAGDEVVSVAGVTVEGFSDYDGTAARFRRGEEVPFTVRRGSEALELVVRPGMAVGWLGYLLKCVAMLCCIGLSWNVARHFRDDLRARLVVVLSLLLALDIALPRQAIGAVSLNVMAWAAFYLATGLQMSVALHLAASLPEAPGWMRHRQRWVPVFYLICGGAGGLATLTYLWEEIGPAAALPWSSVQSETLLLDILVPIWSVVVVALLAVPTVSWPTRRGRLQTGLVLAGVLPIAAYDLSWTVFLALGREFPDWAGDINPLVILVFPVAVFVAVYRYEWLDLELWARRSLLYSILTTVLLLLFYVLVGTGGALFSQVLGSEGQAFWIPTAAALILGLLFAPLRALLQQRIDLRLSGAGGPKGQQLLDLAAELPSLEKVPLLAQRVVDRVGEIFGLRASTLLLADNETSSFVTVASNRRDLQPQLALSVELPPQGALQALLGTRGNSYSAEEVRTLSPRLGERMEALKSEWVVPLAGKHVVGLLLVGGARTGGAFEDDDRALLQRFGPQIATAFENVRLFETATFDGLTGVLRREAVTEILETEVQRAQRYGRALSVAVLDLDHFKEINDRHGHGVGDAALRRVAEELLLRVRRSDHVGRLGGDEFLVVFPETELEDAEGVALGIHRRLGEAFVLTGQGQRVVPEASIGIASLASLGIERKRETLRLVRDDSVAALSTNREIAKRLVEAADAALYRAKERGRGLVAT